jgi:hypothetical protein
MKNATIVRAMHDAWRATTLSNASDGQAAFYAGFAAGHKQARYAVEILIRYLLDEAVPLGDMQRLVSSVRQSIDEGGDDGAAVPILSMPALALALELTGYDERSRDRAPLPNEDLIDWIITRSGNEGLRDDERKAASRDRFINGRPVLPCPDCGNALTPTEQPGSYVCNACIERNG